MQSSPQCSPMRITSLAADSLAGHDQQQADQSGFGGFRLTPPTTFASLHSAAASTAAVPAAQPAHSSPPPPTYFSPAPMSKRVRKHGAVDVSMMEEGLEAVSDEPVKHASPFHQLKRPHLDDLMFVPRAFKKQAINAVLAGPSSAAHATPVAAPLGVAIPAPPSSTGATLPNYHHQLFTYDQVASIVRNALEMREEQIRAEYNRVLQEQLREQFENFSSFNRDYISRNMRQIDQQEDQENSYYS